MIVLDTNVLSEMMRPAERRSQAVFSWVYNQPGEWLFTTAVTTAELLAGVSIIPEGKRRLEVSQGVSRVIALFDARILPFDHAASRHYADVVTMRRRRQGTIAACDLQIAAIARSNGMAVATRNTRDFEDCGIELINPWEA